VEPIELKPREHAVMMRMRELSAESPDGRVTECEIWTALKNDEAFAGTRQGETDIPIEGEILLEGLAGILMNLARQAAKQEWERMSDAPYELDELNAAMVRCVNAGVSRTELFETVQRGFGRVGIEIELVAIDPHRD